MDASGCAGGGVHSLPGLARVIPIGIRTPRRRARLCGRSRGVEGAGGRDPSRGLDEVTAIGVHGGEPPFGLEAIGAVYERFDFVVAGRRPRYYRGGDDAVLMTRKQAAERPGGSGEPVDD